MRVHANASAQLRSTLARYAFAQLLPAAPSTQGAWGQSLIESRWLGHPVVAPQGSDVEEWLYQDPSLIRIPDTSVAAWQTALGLLLDHPQQARQRGEVGAIWTHWYFGEALLGRELAAILRQFARLGPFQELEARVAPWAYS